MVTFLTLLLVFACVLLVTAVLLQPSKGGGLSALGGSSQSVFGSTGGTTFLFRLTLWCAGFIMVTSLFLARYQVQKNRSSLIDGAPIPTAPAPAAPVGAVPPTAPAPVGAAPAAPTAPVTPPAAATPPPAAPTKQ